uniref:Uncharacterized protein n=1 Tax=Pseudomonas phage HRDY3 TaxID=3236930 RepID=A0AB39CEJ6_9VIRU
MDIQALFSLAAMCCKNGRDELALQVLKQACECPEFSSVLNCSLQPALDAAPDFMGAVQGAPVPCAEGGADGKLDGLDSFVDYVDKPSPDVAKFGTAPNSENSISPSLHGNDGVAFRQIVGVASAIYAQKQYLDDGEHIILDPQLSAIASVDLEPFDDESLVARESPKASEPLIPGRIRIKL